MTNDNTFSLEPPYGIHSVHFTCSVTLVIDLAVFIMLKWMCGPRDPEEETFLTLSDLVGTDACLKNAFSISAHTCKAVGYLILLKFKTKFLFVHM